MKILFHSFLQDVRHNLWEILSGRIFCIIGALLLNFPSNKKPGETPDFLFIELVLLVLVTDELVLILLATDKLTSTILVADKLTLTILVIDKLVFAVPAVKFTDLFANFL